MSTRGLSLPLEGKKQSDKSMSSYKNWWNSRKDKFQASKDGAPTIEETEDEYDQRSETLGTRLEIRELYRESSEHEWDEWIPDSVARNFEEGSEFEQYAVIIRREKQRGKPGLVLHSIVVQSPLLREVLDPIFDNYDGFTTNLRKLKFYAPLHEFYYRWHHFEQACQNQQYEATKKHLDLLYPIVSREILPHIQKMRDLTRNGLVTFDYLWAIFAPNTDLYASIDDQDRLYNLRKSYYTKDYEGKPVFDILCRHIDCNGKKFGYVESRLSINLFQGVKKIIDLDTFPSHLHPEPEKLLESLHSRGKKFQELNGFNHVSYSGFYIDKTQGRSRRKRHVESSRIVIDPEMFSIYNSDTYNRLKPLEEKTPAKDNHHGSFTRDMKSVIQRATWKAFIEFEEILNQYETKNFSESSESLTPRQWLLCTPMIRGFCLASKVWAEFYIDNVTPIQWNGDSFKGLVLPDGYKDIIHAFVQEQLSEDDSFDDIIRSKGQGFIMLLSGEPGVGKTLTAESVSEAMQKPLYYISAGGLGETATEVEEALEEILELTTKWRAILLLDECDIFLEQRTTADIARNRLVSIFLKQLEYYRGVLFLTTNRVAAFDPAFESRIHLSINYPALDRESRLHIWRTFVRPDCDSSSPYASAVTDKELQDLSTHELNGRQLKNVVKTARLLARNEKLPLALKHIEKVLNVKKVNAIPATGV